MANQFLPLDKNYAGSAPSGGAGVGVYPLTWNPLTRTTESRYGSVRTPTPLPAIFSGISAPMPIQPMSVAGQSVSIAGQPGQPGQQGVGASPVYPLNVPTGAGVSTISVPRSQNVAAATSGLFADFNAFKESQNKVLEDFKARFPEWFADQQQTGAAERAATNRLYSGAAQAQSDADVANFLTQANLANAKSIADKARLSSRKGLASAAFNFSLGREKELFSDIAAINANAGRDAAVARMQANQWLTQLQQQMAGTQAARNRALLADQMLPAQAESNVFENILRSLQALSPIEQQNLMAGLVGPGGYVGDTFGQLQSAKLQDFSRMSNEALAEDAARREWEKLRLMAQGSGPNPYDPFRQTGSSRGSLLDRASGGT